MELYRKPMLPAALLLQEQPAAISPIRSIAFLMMLIILSLVMPQAYLIILSMAGIA
jgi:hypothetical protein